MLSKLRENLLPVERALVSYGTATAAVAILLRERGGLEVLLQERAARESDPWSGQWAFPGGRRHDGETLLDTARRETEEEVGLSLRDSAVLGCLEGRFPGNRAILVLPFVFRWEGSGDPVPGPEVASVAWVRLEDLPSTRTTANVQARGRTFEMPAFVSGSRTIWGFTFRALEDLLAALQ